MPSRPLLPLLLVLAALGGAAWLLLQEGGPLGGPDSLDHAAQDAAAGTSLDGSGGAAALEGAAGRRGRTLTAPEDLPSGPRPPAFPRSEGVAGRVLDAQRRPIAGARVRLFPAPQMQMAGLPDGEPVAEAETDAQGEFLVGPAEEGGRLRLRAEARGFAPSVVAVPRRGARVEVQLDVGGALSLKVVDGRGAAVAGAAVHHMTGAWNSLVVTSAESGADGVAVFAALPTGTGSVLATKQGLGAARLPEVGIAPGQTLEATVVLTGGRELTGTITNAEDQRPVVGARVEVHYPWVPGLAPAAPVTSGDDGRYRITLDVGVGEMFELRVQQGDFAPTHVTLNYNDGGTGSMTHDVKLGRGAGGISGRVLTREGAAAAGAQVMYMLSGPNQTLPSATTDAEGRFELPAPPWAAPGTQMGLIATSPTEGLGSLFAQLPPRQDARGKPVEIRLLGSGVVEGTVADGAGQPVEGAVVSVSLDWQAMQRPGRQTDWTLVNALSDPRMATRLTAVTDAAGRFALASVPAAVYGATAQWGALSAASDEPLEVRAGATLRVTLTLGEGATIEGTVLDTEDRPVAGAALWAQPQEQRPGSSRSWAEGRSQSDGRFVLRNIGAGPYTLTAQAAGYGGANQRDVTAGTRDVLLRLKAMGWVEGQVVVGGEPLAGTFTVTGQRKGEAEGAGRRMRGMQEEGGARTLTTSSADGRFVLRGLSAGEWALTVTTPDGLVSSAPVAVSVSDGRGAGPVTLPLTQGATLLAELESSDGGPLANAWVWAWAARRPDGTQPAGASGRSDPKGRVRLAGMGAGTFTLSISSESGVQWTETVDLAAGEERRARFRERKPGRVRVTVQDASGQPVAKAAPVLTDASGNQVWPNWQLLRRDGLVDRNDPSAWERATTTDAEGVLLRHHVPPGRYRVSAQREGFTAAPEPDWIEVASDAVTDVTVVLTAAAPR